MESGHRIGILILLFASLVDMLLTVNFARNILVADCHCSTVMKNGGVEKWFFASDHCLELKFGSLIRCLLLIGRR